MKLDEYINKLQELSTKGHGQLDVTCFEDDSFSSANISASLLQGQKHDGIYLTKDPETYEPLTSSLVPFICINNLE